MSEFSGDEGFLFLVALASALGGGLAYYNAVMRLPVLGCSFRQRLPLLFAPLAGLAVVLVIVTQFAANDVKANGGYVLLFLLLGAAWLFWSVRLFSILGLSLGEDSLTQRNPTAIVALSGAELGVCLTYAGGNIGEGATVWTTVFSSLLATAGLFFAWFILEVGSRISLAIGEERDPASGWRLAGFLVATGLILGRAVAGDWQSSLQTEKDFGREGWPALVLAAAAVVVERKSQPVLAQPKPEVYSRGILPATLYLLAGIIVVMALGKWK